MKKLHLLGLVLRVEYLWGSNRENVLANDLKNQSIISNFENNLK